LNDQINLSNLECEYKFMYLYKHSSLYGPAAVQEWAVLVQTVMLEYYYYYYYDSYTTTSMNCQHVYKKAEADKGTYTMHYTLFGRQIKITFKS